MLRYRLAPERNFMVLVFALGAVAVGMLVMAVSGLLADSVRRQALAGAQNAAVAYAEASLEEDEFRNGRVTDEALEDLAVHFKSSRVVREARVWDRDGSLAFSTYSEALLTVPLDDERRAALAGRVTSEITSGRTERLDQLDVDAADPDGDSGDLLEVNVPVPAYAERPSGVLTVYLSSASVRAQIAAATGKLRVVMAGLALVLCLLLLAPLRRASHALAASFERRNPPLARRLRRAIRDGEIEVHYQPQAGRDGAVRSVEALVRWRHPKLGLVPPGEFVPLAERSALIEELTVQVGDIAFADCARWRRAGSDLTVAINLAARCAHNRNLADALLDLCARHDLAPRHVTLEVTETSVLRDTQQARGVLEDARDRGFRISLDDFGSGESSLVRVNELPLDELKLDRSFVARAGERHDLLAGIIDLGHRMGVEVVAEGVEDAETRDLLVALGCDLIQGYHLARPMPVDDLVDWLAAAEAPSRLVVDERLTSAA